MYHLEALGICYALAQTAGSAMSSASSSVSSLVSSPVSFAPMLIVALCAMAGIATVMMLPGRMEPSMRKIGGAIMLAAGLIFGLLLVRKSAGAARAGGINAYFWIFSAIAVAGALRVITHPRPVYSALYFVLTVFASAGLFVLLWAEFMAAALVLIYAGAILITYLFVIMLAAQSVPAGVGQRYGGLLEYDSVSREPLAASAMGFVLMGLLIFVIFDRAPALAAAPAAAQATTADLGRYIFDNQLLNLELGGLILTLAMVGAIVIARRPVGGGPADAAAADEMVLGPPTAVEDDPHSIPVDGTDNPRQKAYPQN